MTHAINIPEHSHHLIEGTLVHLWNEETLNGYSFCLRTGTLNHDYHGHDFGYVAHMHETGVWNDCEYVDIEPYRGVYTPE